MIAALALALGVLGSPALRAEVMIESVSWQLAQPARGRRPGYASVTALPTSPPRVDGRPRLRVVLKSRGPQDAEGLVLRYCLSARLVPAGGDAAGVWAVPFLISEKRVPKIGPNQYLEVTMDPTQAVDLPLHHYLKRTFDSGFWPDQLKAQVMLSPKRGVVEAVKTQELVIPVRRP